MHRLIVLALVLSPLSAQANIIQTDTSVGLDPYSGQAYLIAPPFTGDPATLSSLAFQADVSFNERVQVVGGNDSFTLHFDATMFGVTLASFATPVIVNGGYYATSLSVNFAGMPILPNPELSISAWLTPNIGYFASDAAHSIGGLVYLETFYDPPTNVREPASSWILASIAILGWPFWLNWRARKDSNFQPPDS